MFWMYINAVRVDINPLFSYPLPSPPPPHHRQGSLNTTLINPKIAKGDIKLKNSHILRFLVKWSVKSNYQHWIISLPLIYLFYLVC